MKEKVLGFAGRYEKRWWLFFVLAGLFCGLNPFLNLVGVGVLGFMAVLAAFASWLPYVRRRWGEMSVTPPGQEPSFMRQYAGAVRSVARWLFWPVGFAVGMMVLALAGAGLWLCVEKTLLVPAYPAFLQALWPLTWLGYALCLVAGYGLWMKRFYEKLWKII